jgi:hypothetical protein
MYFGSWFQRFQFMVAFLHCCGPAVRQSIMAAGVCGRANLLTSWMSWMQGSRETRRGWEKVELPRTQPHSDLLPPARPCTYWGPGLQHMSLGDISYLIHNTNQSWNKVYLVYLNFFKIYEFKMFGINL